MFALVLVLKKNGSTFRYLCFSGLLPTFKYLKISKHFHFQIFYIYIYIFLTFVSTDIFWQVSIRSMIQLTSS